MWCNLGSRLGALFDTMPMLSRPKRRRDIDLAKLLLPGVRAGWMNVRSWVRHNHTRHFPAHNLENARNRQAARIMVQKGPPLAGRAVVPRFRRGAHNTKTMRGSSLGWLVRATPGTMRPGASMSSIAIFVCGCGTWVASLGFTKIITTYLAVSGSLEQKLHHPDRY